MLAKYDANGGVLKAILPNLGTNGNLGFGVAVDGAGNTYVVGNGYGFLAKCDTNLNLLWATNCIGQVFQYGMAVDPNGNCFVTGMLVGVVSFGDIMVYGPDPKTSAPDAFLAKYDTTGNCLWAQDIGEGAGHGILVDSATNVLMTGTSRSGDFIAKYDPDGNNLWFQQNSGISFGTSLGIASDLSGNVYVTGTFTGDITFGASSLSSTTWAVFVGKYDSDGNPLWALQSIVPSAGSGAAEIVVDAYGNSFIAGSGRPGSILGAATLVSTNLFLAKVSSDGNWRWVKQAGGNGLAQSFALALAPSGSLYVGGSLFSSPVRFDGIQLNTNGIFVAALDTQPPAPVLTATGATNGGVTLNWPAFPNGIYRAQYKSSLEAPVWTDLAPDVTAARNTASFTDPTGLDPQRYYRIVLLP